MRSVLPVLAASSVVFAACASDTTMSVVGYDASCSATTDCVAVFEGNVCGCSCTQKALRSAAAAQYAKDAAVKRERCGSSILECEVCPTSIVACVAGVCKVTGEVDGALLPAPDAGRD